jgi:hypothetical protein
MVFGQYRMMSFGALIVAMIAFYMGSDRARRKLKIIYTFFIVSMIPIFKVVVTYLTEDMKGASASAGVRNNAMMYYSKILARSPWFGVGSINNTNGVSDALLGAKYGFYLIDLGAFALKFMYGNIMYYFYYLLLGVGVLVGYKYIKKYNNSVLFFFCVYSLVTSMTLLTGYYYSSCVILVLVIALYKGGLLDENRSGNT